MTEKGKFLLLHIGDTQSKEVLKDAFDNGIERGLVLRNNVGKEILQEFQRVQKNGYFPVGCIVDSNNPHDLELLFHRHPQQPTTSKMVEVKPLYPTKL